MKECDIYKWSVGQLPHVMRRPKLVALMSVMVSGVGRIVTRQSRYKRAVAYGLAHNSQVCKLRALLNDKLDPCDRRVEIGDYMNELRPLIVYERSQNRPLYVREESSTLIPPRMYDVSRNINFVVQVPREWRGWSDKVKRVQALVNGNKLSSMRYTIEYSR